MRRQIWLTRDIVRLFQQALAAPPLTFFYGTLSIPIWLLGPCRCGWLPSSWARHVQRMRSFCARSAAAVQRLETWPDPCRCPFTAFFNVKGGDRSRFTRRTGQIILEQATLVMVEDYA